MNTALIAAALIAPGDTIATYDIDPTTVTEAFTEGNTTVLLLEDGNLITVNCYQRLAVVE